MTEHDVVIGGGGFAGVCAAIRLQQSGVHDYLVLERNAALGGTWHDNTYPGCACDVPSALYSYSFRPNPGWSQWYSPWDEIREYVETCAREAGVRERTRTGAAIEEARWDEEEERWHIALAGSGEVIRARFFVSGLGGLVEPAFPRIDGLDEFEGPVFHSARWDHDVPLDGRRVAVVGTGSSAIQFTPRVAERAAHVDVYQRTPPWIIPKFDRSFSAFEKKLYARLPLAQKAVRAGVWAQQETLGLGLHSEPRLRDRLERGALAFIRHQVKDEELRAKVTPDFRLGCKRILVSSEWYPTLQLPHVELVTEPVARLTADAVVDADGVERRADVVILGTGFKPFDITASATVVGRGGQELAEAWSGGPEAHRGTTVHGFPNLFLLCGPNTATGHTSQIFMIESQVTYLVDAIRLARARGLTSVEVKPTAQRSYNAALQQRMQKTVWVRGGCQSWYLGDDGVNRTLWPGTSVSFRRQLRRFDAQNYELRRRAATAPSPVPATAVAAT